MKWVSKSKFLKEKSKELKSNLPKSEKWFLFLFSRENLDIKLKNNLPFCGKIPDFICKKSKIVIEIDGSIHKRQDIIDNDKKKDLLFRNAGYYVIRVIAYDMDSYRECINLLKSKFNIKKKKQENIVKQKNKYCHNKKRKSKNKPKFKNRHSLNKIIQQTKKGLKSGTTRVIIARRLGISKSIIDAVIIKYNIKV